MLAPGSTEERAHKVVLLASQGMTRRAIARALGIGRNTVRKLLAAHADKRSTPHQSIEPKPQRAPRPSKLDPFRQRAAIVSKLATRVRARVAGKP